MKDTFSCLDDKLYGVILQQNHNFIARHPFKETETKNQSQMSYHNVFKIIGKKSDTSRAGWLIATIVLLTLGAAAVASYIIYKYRLRVLLIGPLLLYDE